MNIHNQIAKIEYSHREQITIGIAVLGYDGSGNFYTSYAESNHIGAASGGKRQTREGKSAARPLFSNEMMFCF